MNDEELIASVSEAICIGGAKAARLRCSAVKYIVDSYLCNPMSTRALDKTMLRSSAKCSGVFMKSKACSALTL